MRAVAVHADVIVVVSRVWQTTCTAIRCGQEGFVVDSPVLPDELELLPPLLEQAGFAVSGLLVTHGDWDHLLGRLAFPELALGCAETTAARLVAEPGAAQRELRAWDEQLYLQRPRPLALGATQALPVPGYCALGERELELHPTDGHTPDGLAVWAPWAELLVCGDYLSPVEIPTISTGGSLAGYLATLDRLEPLVRRAATVVPGHGTPQGADAALELLEADRHYLLALGERGVQASLPAGRSSARQRALHQENAARLADG